MATRHHCMLSKGMHETLLTLPTVLIGRYLVLLPQLQGAATLWELRELLEELRCNHTLRQLAAAGGAGGASRAGQQAGAGGARPAAAVPSAADAETVPLPNAGSGSSKRRKAGADGGPAPKEAQGEAQCTKRRKRRAKLLPTPPHQQEQQPAAAAVAVQEPPALPAGSPGSVPTIGTGAPAGSEAAQLSGALQAPAAAAGSPQLARQLEKLSRAAKGRAAGITGHLVAQFLGKFITMAADDKAVAVEYLDRKLRVGKLKRVKTFMVTAVGES